MSFNNGLGDMLTRIRNACSRGIRTVLIPFSGIKIKILRILLEEGYITNFSVSKNAKKQQNILVTLKYYQNKAVIEIIKQISKPGRRIYVNKENIKLPKRGLGTVILSTSQGVMSGFEAIERGTGGEVLCEVF